MHVKEWIQSHLVISLLFAFAAGAYGTGTAYNLIVRSDVGRLDQQLADSEQRTRELTDKYNELTKSNNELGKRYDSIQGGIAEAKGIVESISGSSATAIETVRRVIENLQRLKIILANIPNR